MSCNKCLGYKNATGSIALKSDVGCSTSDNVETCK